VSKLTIIAEVGINHNGNFALIQELVRQASIGGADITKFQLYNSMKLFGDDSRKKNEFTFEQVSEIKQICEFYDIEFMASVFDAEHLEWCETLNVKQYKIASRTFAKDFELCDKIVELNKPVLISLGMWDGPLAYATNSRVSYLNCISKYPATFKDIKLPTRAYETSSRIVGLSDHSYGIGYALHEIAHGARVIEKHFTLDKSQPDNRDHIGSMTFDELVKLREFGDEILRIHDAKK
jgi:sialic acid synthase SpsE